MANAGVMSCDLRAFNFDGWASENGLSPTTTEKLRQEEVVTAEVLRALTSEDIKDLGLTLGQRKLLQQAIGTLTAAPGCQAGQRQYSTLSEAAMLEIKEEMKKDAEAMQVLLRKGADSLDYHFNNVQKARVIGSSASTLAQFMALASTIAAPLTGVSYGNVVQISNITAQTGRTVSKGASAVGTIIEKAVLDQMKAQWLAFQQKIHLRNQMVMMVLMNEGSPTEDDTSRCLQALPAAVEMCAENLMTLERPAALTQMLQILGEEVKGGVQQMTLQAMGDSHINGMINLMVEEDIHDIIDAAVKLSFEIKCPAGEPLRLLADALKMVTTLDLLSRGTQ